MKRKSYSRSGRCQGYSPCSELDARYDEFGTMLMALQFEDYMDAFAAACDSKSTLQDILAAEARVSEYRQDFNYGLPGLLCSRLNIGIQEITKALERYALDPLRMQLPGLQILEKDEYCAGRSPAGNERMLP